MPVPGGTGNFMYFDADSPSQRDGIVAFRGFGPTGQEGIYASIGGIVTKVIDLSDSLDNKTLTHLFLGYQAVSGNKVAFAAQFADGSRGIYVARLAPEIATVSLVIKSGSDTINPKSTGVITVAILTTDTFDASTVDPSSVRFGPLGAAEAHGRGHVEDVNGDGRDDLVLHFRTQDTGIVCGETDVSLTGTSFSGVPIQGSAPIHTVGCR
jgi:hypothetical protein